MYVFCVLFDPRIDVIWEGVKACARGMNIPFSSYFDVHQGIKVLTHSHIWRLICNIYIYIHIDGHRCRGRQMETSCFAGTFPVTHFQRSWLFVYVCIDLFVCGFFTLCIDSSVD